MLLRMVTDEQFQAAVNVINSLPKDGPFQPSPDLMLKFYAFHKQATEGPCSIPRPPFWDTNKSKWIAWKNLGDMSKEVAMKKYVEELVKIIETMAYNESVSNFMDVMGPLYEIVWLDESDNCQSDSCMQSQTGIDADNVSRNKELLKIVEDKSEDSNLGEMCQDLGESSTKVKSGYFQCDSAKKGLLKEFQKKQNVELFFREASKHSSTDSVMLTKSVTTSTCLGVSHCEVRNVRPSTVKSHLLIRRMLSFSIMHLQRSLDDVVQHLDALEILIKNYKAECPKVTYGSSKSYKWGLSPWTASFVFLWPFVVHWIIYILRHLKKRRSAKL